MESVPYTNGHTNGHINGDSQLPPIPPPTKILSLRTGRMAPLGSLSITSGINKMPRDGQLWLDKVGLPDDEHDLTFHGGVDKAVHQYCSNHYPLWREMYPDPQISARFDYGGFGENLVTAGEWDESTVCIGDVVRIGNPQPNGVDYTSEDTALLEVSIPRNPCFKLNQRFGIKNFAGKTHQLNRTGWYYRVLREGWVENGMEMSIVERRNKKWTIKEIHEYVHRDTKNYPVMEELMTVKELGNESKDVFQGRLKKMQDNANGAAKKPKEVWRPFKIVKKWAETPRIAGLVLEACETPDEEQDIQPGSNSRIKLPNGLIRSYSIVSGSTSKLELGIARDENSRGGSVYIHDKLVVGDTIEVGNIGISVPKISQASNHIFIVGGIGITAYLDLIAKFVRIHMNFELHYAVRSSRDVAFADRLREAGECLVLYDREKGERMDIGTIIAERKWNSHIYVCGPTRMTDEVLTTAKELGIPDDEVHPEAFQADVGGDPFDVEVVGRKDVGKDGVFTVGEDESLLEALRRVGMEVQSSCEAGNCGTCVVNVKCGQILHRGSGSVGFGQDHMLSCVSRGVGKVLIELDE